MAAVYLPEPEAPNKRERPVGVILALEPQHHSRPFALALGGRCARILYPDKFELRLAAGHLPTTWLKGGQSMQ
jgi:hypothetical protein